MSFLVDHAHLGTAEEAWERSGRIEALPPLVWGQTHRVVVVAPHPDDEVLGAGGLICSARGLGLEVEVVAVTDGEASSVPAGTGGRTDLGRLRRQESTAALTRLGWPRPTISRLGLPDGSVTAHQSELEEALADRMHPADLWVAPWSGDGHPDHDACGLATMRAAARTGARVLGYLVWAWHWAVPESDDIPWSGCVRLELDRRTAARKRWGTFAFRSQIRPFEGSEPVLPDPVLRHFWRDAEVFVDVADRA
jgi:LmbE family N-acetylglucosaminyl deacetylase